MDDYRTEEEKIKAIKDWWRDNGKSVAAGVIVGIIAIFSWRSYQSDELLQAEAASELYEQMLIASREDDDNNTRIYADRIIADHHSSTYAVFSALMLAKLAVQADDLAIAEKHLRWVLARNRQTGIEHIASLRLIRVLIATDNLQAATDMINAKAVKTDSFIAQYEELRGDILIKQNKHESAHKAYEKAFAYATNQATQSILKMKLDDLGEI